MEPSDSELDSVSNISGIITVDSSENGFIEAKSFHVIYGKLDDKTEKRKHKPSLRRLSYEPWMGAAIIIGNYRKHDGSLNKLELSREKLIKQLANNYNASHSSIVDKGQYEGHYSDMMKFSMECKIGNLPMPYFALLKIASDILKAMPKLGVSVLTI